MERLATKIESTKPWFGIFGMSTSYFYPGSRPLPFYIRLKRSICSDTHETTKMGADPDTILSYSSSVIVCHWFSLNTTRVLF